jgi:hypothetical protein
MLCVFSCRFTSEAQTSTLAMVWAAIQLVFAFSTGDSADKTTVKNTFAHDRQGMLTSLPLLGMGLTPKTAGAFQTKKLSLVRRWSPSYTQFMRNSVRNHTSRADGKVPHYSGACSEGLHHCSACATGQPICSE